RRSHARRPDLAPARAIEEVPLCASACALRDRSVRATGWNDARLAGAGNDVRAVPVLCASRSDRTGAIPRLMATISSDILARYAADAAREVDGVLGLVESALHRHKGVRVVAEDGHVR